MPAGRETVVLDSQMLGGVGRLGWMQQIGRGGRGAGSGGRPASRRSRLG